MIVSLDIQQETGYTFYAFAHPAGALCGGCGILYSEDLQAGQLVHGIQIINPFNQMQVWPHQAVLTRLYGK